MAEFGSRASGIGVDGEAICASLKGRLLQAGDRTPASDDRGGGWVPPNQRDDGTVRETVRGPSGGSHPCARHANHSWGSDLRSGSMTNAPPRGGDRREARVVG